VSEFIPIAIAAERAAVGKSIESGRQLVLTAISQGFLQATAFRARVTELTFEDAQTATIEEVVANRGSVRSARLAWLGGSGKVGELEAFRTFKGTDAIRFMRAVDGEWTTSNPRDRFQREVWTDWSLGRFQSCTLIYDNGFIVDGNQGKGFIFEEIEWLGVEVEEEVVERLLVPNVSGNVMQSNSPFLQSEIATVYDWEAAFADVAASFHFDENFSNPGARGVQTKIVELLRRSFRRRKLPEPGDTILKEKAAKLQGALRGYKSGD
jgi:hypothetical protein